MKVTIKPHSTLQKLFPSRELVADLSRYQDLVFYLNSFFPAYKNYIKRLYSEEFPEVVLFLDKNLKPITQQDLLVKKFSDNDEIYIVPGITGNKKALKIIIGITLILFAGPIATTLLGPTLSATAVAGTTLGAIATTAVVAVGTSLVTMGAMELMMPTMPKTGDSGTAAESAMFASLTNTSASGITTPLQYGQVRVAGHVISGYTIPIPHGPNEVIRLENFITIPTSEEASAYNWFIPETT